MEIMTTENQGKLYRVTYTTSGLRRRTKTVTESNLRFLQEAWHYGIRVTSYREATKAETARGAFEGTFNS